MSKGHALVTGAIGGLGTAITKRLIADGIPVIGTDRRAADIGPWIDAELDDEEKAMFTGYPLDVGIEGQVDELAQKLSNDGIDVAYLINNAGIQGNAKPWELDSKTWHRVIRVNLDGTFYLTRAFSKAMVDRSFGRIVNFASLYAFDPGVGQSPYAAAKAGITGYTRSVAKDLAKHGVTVNVIAPGIIWHERLRGVLPDEEYKKAEAQIPTGRMGEPDEISGVVSFFCSEDSSYVTGETLHVNGGLYLPA
jgi:NAD(P)-dependent dehydrogenase (short-subunit alcohol dehydrogenase family)